MKVFLKIWISIELKAWAVKCPGAHIATCQRLFVTPELCLHWRLGHWLFSHRREWGARIRVMMGRWFVGRDENNEVQGGNLCTPALLLLRWWLWWWWRWWWCAPVCRFDLQISSWAQPRGTQHTIQKGNPKSHKPHNFSLLIGNYFECLQCI